MSHTIYHNIPIKSDRATVYDYITNPVHLMNWWPLFCTGNPHKGEVYNLNFTDEYNWYAEVVVAKQGESFYLKMKKSDPDWDPTTFGYDLLQSGDVVTLKFSHTDWPDLNDNFKHSSYCWAVLLRGLKDYIEKGTIIPFDERS